MKRNIYLVLFGLLLGIGTVSCDNESEELFEQTAAERKSEAIKEYEDALKSSEQGWLFQYFPDENQKYGGYNYVVKFNENDSVKVWYEGMADVTSPEMSLYDVISYGGPVLTFNTYNSLLHYFATPSSAQYNAKGGDYEFLLMSNDNDMITVQGIKTGNSMRLTKITETAEVYLEKIKVVSELFNGASLEGTVNGTEVGISINDHRMVFNYTENEELKSENAPFIPTPTGISFYEPLTILGVTVQGLTLDVEANQLVSTDKEIVIDVIKAPINLTSASWVVSTAVAADRSDAVKAAWDDANAANTLRFPLGTNMYLGSNLNNQPPGLTLSISPYYAQYDLSFEGVKGHSDYIVINKVKGGLNWRFVEFFNPLVDFITGNAPYKTEIDDVNDPKVVKLTSVANPDVWFVLRN